MSGTILRSSDFRNVVAPILNKVFDGIHEQRKEWKEIIPTYDAIPRSYHEEVYLFGMQQAQEVPEGTNTPYDAGGQLYVSRFDYRVYGLAYAMTKVMQEDGDHIRLGKIFAEQLAQAMHEAEETNGANLLNYAFSTNPLFTGGDGQSLLSSAHPDATGATQSNVLNIAAAFGQASLEQLLVQIHNAKDATGKRIRLTCSDLVVPPALMFQAEVVLKSALRSGESTNDINPIKSMSAIKGHKVLTRLSSPKAWYVKTTATKGLMHLERRKIEKSMEGDFETDSMRYKSTQRYAFGWHEWRGLYGTPGA
jgi:hypothetical protein